MDAAERWLKENAIECAVYNARLSAEKCRQYAANNPEACARCPRSSAHPAAPALCTKPGCDKPHHAGGLCRAHHHRSQFQTTRLAKTCSVAGCGEKHYGKGRCVKHYHRNRYRTEGRPERMFTLSWSKDSVLYRRLVAAAKQHGTTPAEEAEIFIEACLDHYGVN